MHALVMELEDLPQDSTSVTYPDSFTAMAFAPEYGLPYEARPYHEKVFRLDQIHDLIDEWGLPEDPVGGYADYETRPFEMYVEIQLWTDEPITRFLDSGT